MQKKITASLLYLNILYVIFEIYASLERFYTNQLTLLATFKTLNAIIIDSDRSDSLMKDRVGLKLVALNSE